MVLGWLTRITLLLALVAVLGYDGIALGVAQMSVRDAANTAASAALDSYHQRGDDTSAYAAAEATLPADEQVVDGSLTLTSDGEVDLKVHKQVHTLVVKHLPHLKTWADVTVDGSATRP